MSAALWGAAAGACVGGGVWLFAREVWPAGPDLSALIRAQRAPVVPVSGGASIDGAQLRLGKWLRTRSGGRVPIPHRDLATVRMSSDAYVAQVALCGLYGLLLPLVVGVFAATFGMVSGVTLTVVVPAGVGVVAAVVLAAAPASTVKARAVRARREFLVALAAYLELIALERAADASPGAAVTRAASVGQGWAFTRIRDSFHQSRLTGVPPWRALAALGDELDVPDLGDLAATVEVAGDGGSVYDTLVAKAASMRSAAQSAAKARGNAVSTRMLIPATMIFYALLTLILFPVLAGLH